MAWATPNALGAMNQTHWAGPNGPGPMGPTEGSPREPRARALGPNEAHGHHVRGQIWPKGPEGPMEANSKKI